MQQTSVRCGLPLSISSRQQSSTSPTRSSNPSTNPASGHMYPNPRLVAKTPSAEVCLAPVTPTQAPLELELVNDELEASVIELA